ncbi:hypothetical protein KP509_09G010700 [Ceratopteris richardii]|uniref:BHLH domain-containing protein n=2 Tax=Ceratopteris richardii TaxID=49495 RepID=A0A8T2U4V3_CERRI|nr:hypothetical protein KP509_09G010700 [Ceratopteris richardii]
MAGADQCVNVHRTIESEVVVPSQHTPAFTSTGSQKTTANAVSESVVNSKLHRSGITVETSAHTGLLSTSLMQTDPMENRYLLDRCSPQYESGTKLPKLGEKLQQQNLVTALKGELVASSAGRRGVKRRQVESLDADCISSGNSSGDHHHEQDKEMNDLAAINHMYTERRRRKRQRECFADLRKLVPNIGKVSEHSFRNMYGLYIYFVYRHHTIMFIKELQSKADELERLYSLKDEVSVHNT